MLLNDLIEGLKDMFFTFLYTCFRCICELIDFIKEIFYMLCGIESVEIDGSKGDMLTSLLKSDSVKKAFLTILLIGVILLVLFTGIVILKSNYQEKQSWAGAFRKSGQSLLITLLIPFTVLAGILGHVLHQRCNEPIREHVPSSDWRTVSLDHRKRMLHWF